MIDNKNRASVVLERQMLYSQRATYTFGPKVQGGTGKRRKIQSETSNSLQGSNTVSFPTDR